MTTARIAKRTRGRLVATLVLALVCASCQPLPDASSGACLIEGPRRLVPRNKLDQLQLGLSKSSVDRIMGAPLYSPAPGQFYYHTGGDCPLGDPAKKLSAPCGLVADFVVQGSDAPSQEETGELNRCWWGAIVHGFSRELGSGGGARPTPSNR